MQWCVYVAVKCKSNEDKKENCQQIWVNSYNETRMKAQKLLGRRGKAPYRKKKTLLKRKRDAQRSHVLDVEVLRHCENTT